MSVLNAIMVGIGVVIGLIVLVVLLAFLIELVKAFSQLGKETDSRGDDKVGGEGRGGHRKNGGAGWNGLRK